MTRWAWGCDVSTKRVAIGALSEDGRCRWTDITIPPALKGAQRLAAIRSLLFGQVGQFAQGGKPTAILVEDAQVGPSTNFPLTCAVGVVMECLYAVTLAPVLEIPIGTWKRDSIGQGNALKDAVAAHARTLGYTAPDGVGPGAWNQDTADSICIAQAALGRLPTAA